jgi:hypothetical protein
LDQAIAAVTGPQRDDLIALRSQLLSLVGDGTHDSELASQFSEVSSSDLLTEELKSLEGTKCQAPFDHKWGHTSYQNALITDVLIAGGPLDYDDAKVRVKNSLKNCSQFFKWNNCVAGQSLVSPSINFENETVQFLLGGTL